MPRPQTDMNMPKSGMPQGAKLPPGAKMPPGGPMPPGSKRKASSGKGDNGGPGPGGAAAQGRIRVNADSGKTLKRLLSYIKGKYLAKFVLSLLFIVATSLISVKSSTFLGSIIDDCIKPLIGSANPDYSGLLKAILIMAGYYVASIAATLIYNLLMVDVSNGILKEIRGQLFRHMQTLPVGYYHTNPYGDLMSRYTNDIDNIRQMLSQSLTQVFSMVISIVAVFVAMLRISFRLTLLVLAFVALMYFVTITIGGRSARFFGVRQAALGDMNAYVEEMLNGQKVVKVFCHEEANKAVFDVKNEELFRTSAKANSFAGMIMPIMGNLGNMQYAVVAMIGGVIAINSGGLTLGNIASFLNLSSNFTRPISMISQQINSVVMALAGASRVFSVLDEESEPDEGRVSMVKDSEGNWCWNVPKEDGSFELIRVRGDIRMNMVDFSYVPGKPVLTDITLFAKPGQKIAFVGSTGAGKTTITNLINRFYDIEDGKITYDGISLNDIKKDDLRHSLGFVLQDTNLFTGSVMENIRYGRPEATDEEVIAAAKLANAHSFIEKLPQGYDTVISGSGSQLSQGQCQLLSIARCAVADPPVMILDEATSSVDTRTETLIQQGMDRLMAGRTVFVIAHRLSTVQNSNAIMVLENGRIIERGSHDDLIAQKGRYYQLYTGKTE